MASEDIGGVSISVNVDLSDLDAKFQAAVAEAAADGQKIGQALADGIGTGAESGAAAFDAAMQKLVSDGASANEAFQKLTGSTQTFMEALQSGALSDFADNFGKITQEAQAAAPAIDQVASSAKSAADALGQMSQSSAGGFSLGSIGSGVTDGLSSITSGLGQLDQATVISTADFGALGNAMATMGGIALGIGGLKMLATDMMDAADNLTRAQISLTALTGSAAQAQGILAGLAELGMQDGLSMPGLRQAAISMEAILPVGTNIVGVLSDVANAAAVMGTNVDSLAARFDRIVESGTVSARFLTGFGLNLDDLKQAMIDLGASAGDMGDNVAKAMKNLDPEGRLMVMQEAMQKFQGIAEDVAQNTFGGMWQQATNTFNADLATMGQSAFQFVQQMQDVFNFPSLNETINETVADIYRITTAFQVVADGVAAIVAEIVTAVSGIGTAFSRLFSGDWSGAVQAIKDLGTQMDAAWKTGQDQVAADVQAGQDKIAGILKASQVDFKLVPSFQAAADQAAALADMAGAVAAKVGAIGAVFDEVSGKSANLADHFTNSGVQIVDQLTILQKATKDFYDSMSAAVDPTNQEGAALDALGTKISQLQQGEVNAVANLINTQKVLADVTQAYEDGAKSWGDVELAENKVAAASTNLEAIQKRLATAQDDFNAKSGVAVTAAKAVDDAISNLGGETLTAADNLHDLGITLLDIQPPPQMDAINTAMADLASAAKAAKVPVDDLITDIGNLAHNPNMSWEDFDAKLNVFDQTMQKVMKTDAQDAVKGLLAALGQLADNNAPLAMFNQQLATTDAAIKKLATEDIGAATAAWDTEISKMQQAGDSIGKVLSMQAEEAQANITWAEQSGTAADDWVYKLESVRLKQEELKSSADGMSTAVVSSINDVNKGFDQLGQTIADAIVNGKNLGDALVAQFKKIATSILGDLIQGALQPLKQNLLDLEQSILPTLSASFKVAGESAAQSAEGFKNETDAINATIGAQKDVTKSTEDLANSTQQVSGQMGTFTSSLTSWMSAIGAVIGAIAGIVGDVYLAAIDTKLFSIETSTNRTANDLANLRADQWSQYNNEYERQGEMINLLQSIDGSLKTIVQQGPGGAGSIGQAAQNDLDSTAKNSSDILTALQAIQGLTQTIASDNNLEVEGLQNINNTVYTIWQYLPVIDKDINAITAALLYSGGNVTNSMHAMSMSLDSLGGQQAATGHDVIIAVNRQVDTANQVLAVATEQYAVSQNTVAQIALLQAQIKDDQALQAQAVANGDFTLAQSYADAAQQLSAKLDGLESTVQTTASSTNAFIAGGASTISASLDTTSGFVVTAVDRNGTAITNAIASSAYTIGSVLASAVAGLSGTTIPYTPGRANMGSGQPAVTSPYDPSMYNGPATTGPGGSGPGAPLGTYNPPGVPSGPVDAAGYNIGSPADLNWQYSQTHGGAGLPTPPGLATGFNAPPPPASSIITPPTGTIISPPQDQGPLPRAPVTAGQVPGIGVGGGSGSSTPTVTLDQAAIDKLAAQVGYDQNFLSQQIAGGASKGIIDQIQAELSGDQNALAKAQGLPYSSSGSTNISSNIPGTIPMGSGAPPPGPTDASGQLAQAIKNETDIINGLKSQAADLTNQITAAVANNDQATATSLQTSLQNVNSSLGGANTILSEIQSTAPTATVTQQIADNTALTPGTIKQAIDNEKATIAGLATHLSDLNTELINAIATNVNGSNDALIATINNQIGQTNSEINADNGILKQIGGIADTIAANTAPKAPSNTPPSGVGPGSNIGNVAYSGMPLGYGYGDTGVPNNLPKFAAGGIMPYTGMAQMEGGEIALPPDLSAMLIRMASTPDMAYSPRNPAASAAVPPGVAIGSLTFNVYGGSAADNVRQIAAYMKVTSPKLAALSS